MTVKTVKKISAHVILYTTILISGCDFLYAPKTQPSTFVVNTDTTHTGTIGTGYLYPINPEQQACNPSISQNQLFPGCLLWLGFNVLSVRIPAEITGYDTITVAEHDRLTILDIANYVRWYIMRSDFESRGELQCPEWSTHPDYLACLVGTISQPYSGYAVRISNKQILKICNKSLEEFSNPHFWLPDSAVSVASVTSPLYDTTGFVKKEFIEQFFGTTQFKFVYVLPQKAGTIYYVDYCAPGEPVPVPLQKPGGKENQECGSPLVSPDGNWVTYHCFSNSAQGTQYSSYIQRLKPDSRPVLIANGASDPHWWIDIYNNNNYNIVYTVTKGAYFSDYNYSDPLIEETGVAGATLKKHLKGTPADVPAHVGTLDIDAAAPDTLVRLPFKGGLSRDGYFLGTAYKYAYLMKLK